MTAQEDLFDSNKIVFDADNQERKSWTCLGQSCSRCFVVFLARLFVILLIIFGCSWWRINSLGGNFVYCSWIRFTTKTMNKLISAKNRVFISLVGPPETGKPQLIYKWLKVGTFQPKLDKIYFLYQHSQPSYDVVQKEIENFPVCSRCKLWIYKFVEKQLYKVPVNLWRFMWRVLQFRSVWWYWYYWKTWWNEHYVHWAQPVSSKQTCTRCWAPKHAHCSLPFSPWRDASQCA